MKLHNIKQCEASCEKIKNKIVLFMHFFSQNYTQMNV